MSPSELFGALADPTRLRILGLLQAEKEICVCDLCEILGQSQPRISRHLRLLGESGLITRHREGTWAFHRLTVDPRRAAVPAHAARNF